jgi:hypothetical protein
MFLASAASRRRVQMFANNKVAASIRARTAFGQGGQIDKTKLTASAQNKHNQSVTKANLQKIIIVQTFQFKTYIQQPFQIHDLFYIKNNVWQLFPRQMEHAVMRQIRAAKFVTEIGA